MQINLIYDSSVGSAPPEFQTDMAFAAQQLDSLIINPITVNIVVGYGEFDGTRLPGTGSQGGFGSLIWPRVTYAQLKGYLQANASSAADATSIASLPATDPTPTGDGSFLISLAQEKAWGLLPANGTEIDGYVGISSSANFNYDLNDRSSGLGYDFVGLAQHELTHALGRLAGLDAPGGGISGAYTALDLFRYSAPGDPHYVGGTPDYFSIDGGRTNLNVFSTNSDYGDWEAAFAGPDSFDDDKVFGVENPITPTDVTLMDVIGFTVAGNGAPPSAKFLITDTSTGISTAASGSAYAGPVPGLQNEYLNITTDNLNIAAATPNVFIHSGSGEDALAAMAGINVLDGGTGSNFLTGGNGTDTFFVDDRGPLADIWSTVVNFHAGDAATVWGVTPQDFALNWVASDGTPGFTGLTLHATAPGVPEASLTLTGYTSADLSNGRLSVTFGTDAASGSHYMYIVGTG